MGAGEGDAAASKEKGGGVERTSLDGVRDKNVMQLKKLNTALFPVRYNNKYYQDTIASKDFSKLAYYSDICVGAITCRLEKKEGGAVCVYIMTLGVLAPYRSLGIGTKLLNHVIELCEKQNIPEIYLHVQTNNDDAIAFYKKFGFEITKTIEKYYKNITPPDCHRDAGEAADRQWAAGKGGRRGGGNAAGATRSGEGGGQGRRWGKLVAGKLGWAAQQDRGRCDEEVATLLVAEGGGWRGEARS
uniref:N-acetyltransferase domain-containing protein n=1 Tax=Leersia perrieri TaxID=77586 RepID=A0A0D9V2T0_9ORYZ